MHEVRTTQVWGSAFFCSCVAFPAFAQNLATGTGIEIPYARIAAGLIICLLIAFAAALVIRNFRLHQNFGGNVAQSSRPSSAFWRMAQLGAGLKEKLGNFPGEIRVLESVRRN
jgi:hypothetical protein